MAKVKPRKVSNLTPKKKCCRSSQRCLRCPFVINRMKKFTEAGLSDKELKKELKKARSQ